MRTDNPIPRPRATTTQRAPNPAKAPQNTPKRAVHRARAKRTQVSPRRLRASSSHSSPISRRASAQIKPSTHPLIFKPACRADYSPLHLPDSPSFPPAKTAKTPQKPAKNPHFAPARRAANPLATPHPVNSYSHSLPQSRAHATFFPAQTLSAPAQKQVNLPLAARRCAFDFSVN
jgi:hypothetical protein